MIVKGTKQLGNFKRGVNLYVPKRRSAAAPSGIPVATAGDLIISFGLFTQEYYVRQYSNLEWIFTHDDDHQEVLAWNSYIPNTWFLYGNFGSITATNPSTSSQFIPTTGWGYTSGTGPSITITAA